MSTCHGTAPTAAPPRTGRLVVLAGNPNVGKSAVWAADVALAIFVGGLVHRVLFW